MTTVAIAGAGLGGLTAALALARRGVRVELFDRSAVLSEAGAGVQLSPNATRVLHALGLLQTVAATAVRPENVRVRRGRDGTDLVRMTLGAAADARFGAPFLVAHRADVQAALLAAVRSQPGVSLTTGAALERFEVSNGGVRFTIRTDGVTKTLDADGLIGADGLHSIVRAQLRPDPADRPRFGGRTAWRAMIPAESAPPHARQPTSNLWLGPKAHLVHYPVRGGRLVNVVAIVDGAWSDDGTPETWARPGDATHLRARFAGWHAEARALLEAAPDWRVWPLLERSRLSRWSRGPVTLLGDAAHPMLPFLAQGAAQAIQDGWALASAVAAAPDFAAAAQAYEAGRRPLAERVRQESRRQGTVYHLGGAAASLRDAAMKLLGPGRMLARYDWLYGVRETAVD